VASAESRVRRGAPRSHAALLVPNADDMRSHVKTLVSEGAAFRTRAGDAAKAGSGTRSA